MWSEKILNLNNQINTLKDNWFEHLERTDENNKFKHPTTKQDRITKN